MNGLFSVMSPLNGGTLDTWYRDNEYPYDLNGALDYVRPRQMPPAHYPQVPTIGYIQGCTPLMNDLSYSTMYGKTPFGVWVGEVPNELGMMAIFPNIGGGLRKVNG